MVFSTASYAGSLSSFNSNSFSSSDISIDRVRVNGQAFAEGRTNFLQDSVNNLDVVVSLTAIKDLSNIHVEAILTDSSSGRTVADSSGTFILNTNQSTLVALSLQLIDSLKSQKNFQLEIKVVGLDGNTKTKTYGLKFTGGKRGTGVLDLSINRVKVNDKVVATSRTNFIDRSNDFDVLVEFTALEDLKDAHVEAVLRDLKSGDVVADASPNFDLNQDSSSSILLKVELLGKLKQSDSFELTVKIIDADGHSIQQVYGLNTKARGQVSGAGRQLDVSVDNVEFESKVLAENQNNFLVIKDNKKDFSVRVRLTSLENAKDVHIDTILTFENGDVVADSSTTFDIIKDQNAVKSFQLPSIIKSEQNNFKLVVRVVNADGDSEEKSYGLVISQKEFPFIISSISLSPESNVEAGKSLIAKLTFKNSGVVPLEGVNARVSIPELGVSSTKFVDQIKNNKLSELSEDFILKILDTVPTGTYTVKSEISSQFGGASEVKEIPVYVLGKDEQSNPFANEKLVVNVPILRQDISNDGSEKVYPITLTNEGAGAKTYSLLFDIPQGVNLRLSDANVLVIKPKESKTINIYASTTSNIKGEHIFLITIRSNDNVLKELSLTGNFIVAKGTSSPAQYSFEIFLIIVVAIIILGLSFAVAKYIQSNKQNISDEIPDKESGEAYY